METWVEENKAHFYGVHEGTLGVLRRMGKRRKGDISGTVLATAHYLVHFRSPNFPGGFVR